MTKAKDTALTLIQLLENVGANFEDENIVVDIIETTLEEYTQQVKPSVSDEEIKEMADRFSSSNRTIGGGDAGWINDAYKEGCKDMQNKLNRK